MLNFVRKYWPLIIIFVFSLTPLLWFKGNLIIAGGDESILLNPGSLFRSVFYAWNETFNAGNLVGDYQGNVAHLFPLVFFWFLLGKIGLSLVLIEKLWFISTWFFTGLGMYYLCQVVFRDRVKANLIGVLAVTLYLFNLFVMLYPLMYTVKIPLMIAPWSLAFTIKGLETNKTKYAIYFALVSVFGASGWVNPPAAAIMVILPFFYFLFYLALKKKFIQSLIFFVKTAFFFILFNIYWLVPFLENLLRSAGEIKQSGTNFFFDTSSLFDPLRFLGGWFFREFSHSLYYFPQNTAYYDNAFLIIFSYLIIIIALSGYAFIKEIKSNKNLIYFLLVTIIGLFLVKGSYSPLGFLYDFAYQYLPGFWIFREPYSKFTPIVVLTTSVMFGYSLSLLIDFSYSKTKKIFSYVSKTTLYITAILVIITLSYPLVLGESIWHYYDGPARPYYAKIPNDWLKLTDWLKENDPHATILTLPKTSKGSTTYDWESGFTMKGSVAQHILPNPYFYYQYLPIYTSEKMVKEVYDQIVGKKSQFLTQELGFFGIKYLLVQKDINTDYIDGHFLSYPENMTSLLEKQKNIEKVFSSDKLDLWKISDNLTLDKIFASTNPLYLTSSETQKQLINLLEANNREKENNLVISGEDKQPIPPDTSKVKYFSLLKAGVDETAEDIGSFLFKVDSASNYKLFFLSENSASVNKIFLNNKQLDVNLTKITPDSKNAQKQWLITNLGELSIGEHQIYVNPINRFIELNDNSFEKINKLELNKRSNSWELIDASRDEKGNPQFSVFAINDAYEGQKSLRIQAEGHTAGVRQKLTLQKSKDYILEFAYKNFDDQPFSYSFEYLTDKNGREINSGGFDEFLPISYEWKKHRVFFQAESDLVNVYFYSRGIKQKQTVAVDSVTLGEMNIDPNSFFIKEIKPNNYNYQKLTFQKINPTKYLVKVKDVTEPYYLNFMESFDSNWKIYSSKGNTYLWENWFKKPLASEKNHFLLNGFANSWKIDKIGNQQIVIEYKPQNLLTLLYIVSILSILISLVYLYKIRWKDEF